MSGQESKPVSAPPSLDVFRKADQRALDGIPTGFCVCRADGGLIRYNRRAAELWGRTRRSTILEPERVLPSAVTERMAPLFLSIPRRSASHFEPGSPWPAPNW